jgi:hypothetical protein
MKIIQVQDNRNHIMKVLSTNDLDCEDLDTICMAGTMVLSNYIEEIVVSTIFYHLMNNRDLVYLLYHMIGKIIISNGAPTI